MSSIRTSPVQIFLVDKQGVWETGLGTGGRVLFLEMQHEEPKELVQVNGGALRAQNQAGLSV